MPTKKEHDRIFNQTPNMSYDISTYWTDTPNYVQIMVDTSGRSTYFTELANNPILDDPNKNTSVGAGACSVVNLCVPSIFVPDVTKQLVNDILDATGKPTSLDYKVAEELHKIADEIANMKDGNLRTSDKFPVGDIQYTAGTDISSLNYDKHTAINTADLPDKDFADIAKTTANIVTNENTPCRPETIYTPPDPPKKTDWQDKKYDDLAKQLEDLMKTNPDPERVVAYVANSDLTDRTINGNGIFDWVSKALFNQLEHAKNKNLINNSDFASIYTQTLIQGLQISATFALERDKTYWQNMLQQAQLQQANIAALLAKAEILLLPSKMELAYAQLEIQRQQIELTKYQVEVAKLQIPQMAAQLDQTREQTAVICVQKKQALEELAEAELNRKLKQVQIEAGVLNIKASSVDVKIKEHQADQAEIQTQLSLLQVEQGKEDTKIKNTQWQLGLKQLKAADAQIKQIQADIKLKAQQLLKDREQVALIKAQTATQYAQVTATSEAIKAAKAQYSDTIDGAPVGGILGAQISVNKMQAECFDRDSFWKFASLVKDGWTAKKTADMATLSPNIFTAWGVDRVFNWQSKNYFNMPDNVFETPSTYVDYLSDEQMDGVKPTPSTSGAKVK